MIEFNSQYIQCIESTQEDIVVVILIQPLRPIQILCHCYPPLEFDVAPLDLFERRGLIEK